MEEKEQLSDAKISAERLKNMKPHSLYKYVEGIPIPAQNGVLVKQMPKSNIIENLVQLDSGETATIYGATGNNTQDTCEGIIMSVGPRCSNDVRVGLKVQYSSQVATNGTKFRHKMVEYLSMDEYSILFYMPDESTTVDNGIKHEKQVRREKKIPQEQKIINAMHQRDLNEKDKQKDKTKGKIKPVSNKLR